jgi:hypothetical protein
MGVIPLPRAPFYLGLVVVLAAVTTAACSSSGAGVAAASCVSPSLTAWSSTVRVGEQMKVSGQWFFADCNDVVIGGSKPPPNTPVAAVQLVLRTHGGQLFDLGVAHPDSEGSFTVTITVPEGAQAGPAQIKDKAGLGLPAKITLNP